MDTILSVYHQLKHFYFVGNFETETEEQGEDPSPCKLEVSLEVQFNSARAIQDTSQQISRYLHSLFMY